MSGMKTPLYDWHKAHGANVVDFGGWDMPLWYETGAVREHLAVVQSSGLFDTSHMAGILVDGPDAFDLLQYCFTKDLDACIGKAVGPLVPGRAVYGAFLKENGNAIDDAIVYRFDETSFMVVVNANMGPVIAEHLSANKNGSDANIQNMTGKLGKMDVQGPLAGKVMAKVLAEPDKVFGKMPYFSFKGHFDPSSSLADVSTRGGCKILLSRTGYTGEFGFEIFVMAEDTVAVWEEILAAGSEFGLIPCGLAARDSLRAGAVLPLSHQDIGDWPFINHPWSFALPFDESGSAFTKSFLGERVLVKRAEAAHTLAYIGKDPRKVALHGPNGEPAIVLDEGGEKIGEALTCVADMALGRVDGRVYSVAEQNLPDGFKARGMVCGFVRVTKPLEPGTVIVLQDNRRKINVEICRDVRPGRTARRPIREMV